MQGAQAGRSRAAPDNLVSPELLLGLFVLSVLFAPAAVFRDVQSVRIVFLVFHARVVAAFAIATSERDDNAVVFLRHVPKPLNLCRFGKQMLSTRTEKKDPLPGVNAAFYRLLSTSVNKSSTLYKVVK